MEASSQDYFAVGGRSVLNPQLTLLHAGRYDGQPGAGSPVAGRLVPPLVSGPLPPGPPSERAASGACPPTSPPAPVEPAQVHPSAAAPPSPAGAPGAPAGFAPPPRALAAAAAAPARVRAPRQLQEGFDPGNVRPLQPGRFEMLGKLQDATRNCGVVHRMRDTARNMNVAVKQMPNAWFRRSHEEFMLAHPAETEMPWCDIGAVRFLNEVRFEYACSLLGVYRDDDHTYVVTTLASEGDLFSWCEQPQPADMNREVLVHPLACQILKGVQQLHDFDIVHRDLSLENILLTRGSDGKLHVQIIDFGTASTTRFFKKSVTGKASYQAPELHTGDQYDAFLSDAFSLGVTLYAIIVQDYPWLSTRPGGCKCFEYVRKRGFLQYLDKRKLRNSEQKIGQVISEELQQLLGGLLAFNPDERLTLGERAWEEEPSARKRGSVWDATWLRDGPPVTVVP